MIAPLDPETRMNTEEAAAYLDMGLKPKTLAQWRSDGIGPRYLKVGGRVQYTAKDIHDYLATCRR